MGIAGVGVLQNFLTNHPLKMALPPFNLAASDVDVQDQRLEESEAKGRRMGLRSMSQKLFAKVAFVTFFCAPPGSIFPRFEIWGLSPTQ